MTVVADNIRSYAGKTIRYCLLETDARGTEFFAIATEGKLLLGGIAWRALVFVQAKWRTWWPRRCLACVVGILGGLPTTLVGGKRFNARPGMNLCCFGSCAQRSYFAKSHDYRYIRSI